MIELDNIRLQTTWNDAAQGVNSNFAKISVELEKLKSSVGGDFNSVPMWAELAGSDPTKLIDLSHIPSIPVGKLVKSAMSLFGKDVSLGGVLSVKEAADALTAAGYKLTDTKYDLSPYAKTADVLNALREKVDIDTFDEAMASQSAMNATFATIEQMNKKADSATVNAALAKKSDKTETAAALTEAKTYTDTKIGDLIGGAPETLDTLKEIADEIAKGGTAMDALVNEVGRKADKTALDAEIAERTEGDTALTEALDGAKGRITTLEGYFSDGKAKDSEKFGGQLPSYYATATALNAVDNAKVNRSGDTMTGGLSINFKRQSANNLPMSILVPDMNVGDKVGYTIGKEASMYNRATIGFEYSGGATNAMTLGLYGVDNILTINGERKASLTGHLYIDNTSTGKAPIEINFNNVWLRIGPQNSYLVNFLSNKPFFFSNDIFIEATGLYPYATNKSYIGSTDKRWLKLCIQDIEASGNIIASGAISAQNGNAGAGNVTGGDGGGMMDSVQLWYYLGQPTTEQINASHLSDFLASLNLSQYATVVALNDGLGTKVDKVDGKGLSTNDFTTALKTKLEGINMSLYLPKAGGRMSGQLFIETGADNKLVLNNTDDERWNLIIFQHNGVKYGEFGSKDDSTLIWNDKEIYHKGNLVISDYLKVADANNTYLPLTGGTLINEKWDFFSLKRTTIGAPFIKFENIDGVLGYIAITRNDGPIWADSNTYIRKLLHEGNFASIVTPASIGLGNVQNTAFYKRYATVNGDQWDIAGTLNRDAFSIYAPTTAGTSGQVLVSTGGRPSWKSVAKELSAGSLSILDTRNNDRTPAEWADFTLTPFFTNQGMPPKASWWSGLSVRGWEKTYVTWQLVGESGYGIANRGLHYRIGSGDTWQPWKTIAFTDSDITGTAANALALNGHSMGFSNGMVPRYVDFPGYDSLGTSTWEAYFKELCKWAYANFANTGALLLIGMAREGSTSNCQIQLYSNSGADANGYPRYCSGIVTHLDGKISSFSFNDYVWTYRNVRYVREQVESADYANTAGQADTLDGLHASSFMRIDAHVPQDGHGDFSVGSDDTKAWFQSLNSLPLCLNPLGNNVLIGTDTNNGYLLDVNGTMRVRGTATVNTLESTGSVSVNDNYFIKLTTSGAWTRAVGLKVNTNGLDMHLVGAKGSNNTLEYMYLGGNSASPLVKILANGNMMVGAAEEGYKLSVAGSVNAPAFNATKYIAINGTNDGSNPIRMTAYGVNGNIGPRNERWFHIETDAPNGVYVNKSIHVDGGLLPYNSTNKYYLGVDGNRWILYASSINASLLATLSGGISTTNITATGDIVATGAISAQSANPQASTLAAGMFDESQMWYYLGLEDTTGEKVIDETHIPVLAMSKVDGLSVALAAKVDVSVFNTAMDEQEALNATFANIADLSKKLDSTTASSTYATKTSVYTKAETDAKIAALVDTAPEALNTLNELAAALGDDPNFATTVSNQIGLKADKTYVDSEVGTLETSIGTVSANLSTEVQARENAITALTGVVNTKADAKDLTDAIATIPTTYLKNATKTGQTLTITKHDGTTVTLTNSTYTIASLMGSTAVGGASSYAYWTGSKWSSKALGANAFTDTVIPTVYLVDAFVDGNVLRLNDSAGNTYRFENTQYDLSLYAKKTDVKTYSKATSSALGLVKIGYAANGKNYAVVLNDDGQMYVNVPWEAGGTYTLPLASSFVRGGVKIGFAGSGTSGSFYNLPLYLKNEQAYVQLTKASITTALGYTPPTLGTTAGTACAGNDSRLSDSRPASDVYAWAKASTKPSYTWDEIGGAPSIPDNHLEFQVNSDNYYKFTVGERDMLLSISTGTTNGTINFFGTNVAVKGLGSLAYRSSLAKSDVGLGNVENKSSATIRGELTKANVTTALGYTPPTKDTTYGAATADTLGLVKIGWAPHWESGSYYELPLKMSDGQAFVDLTKERITTALGYTPPQQDTTYGLASATANGLLSKDYYPYVDRMKYILDNTSLIGSPSAASSADATKVTLDLDCTYIGMEVDDYVSPSWIIESATTTKAGLMSAADKAKLDSLNNSGGGDMSEIAAEIDWARFHSTAVHMGNMSSLINFTPPEDAGIVTLNLMASTAITLSLDYHQLPGYTLRVLIYAPNTTRNIQINQGSGFINATPYTTVNIPANTACEMRFTYTNNGVYLSVM